MFSSRKNYAFRNTNSIAGIAFIYAITALFLFFVACPDAFASASSGGGFEYEDWLVKIVNSIKGPVAYAIGIASIVAAGATLAWGGELSGFIKTLIYLACVIGIIIGAGKFLANLTGVGAIISNFIV